MFPRSVAELGPRSEKPSDIQLFPTSDPRVKPEDDGLGRGRMEPYATADQVWAGGLIFARIGAIFLTLPGIGESYVPPRIRLSFALLMALLLGLAPELSVAGAEAL